ncbi:MAG: helix-turn-helix domain-containing protein [Candidatus Delongbacteria bacterium]|nr:helix-turn-helix domain-containing protein [Candidatus Delongbacteria bacterium]
MTKDIGKRLEERRDELDLSLEEVSNKTKIQVGFLNSIENNDRSEVPTAYFDLFLKKYARFLGVEIEQPISNTPNKKRTPKKKAYAKNDSTKELENKFTELIKDFIFFIQVNKKLSLVVFLFLIIFTFVKIAGSIFSPGEISDTNEPVVTIITIEGSSDDKLNFDIRDSILIEDEKSEFMIVKINAVDSCYVCYYSDTVSVKEKLLLPGEFLLLKGEKIIESKIGNSTAVSITFNNESVLPELKSHGNGSSMIRVTPRNGAENIKSSEKILTFLKDNYGLE